MRFTRVGDNIEVGRDPVIIKGKNYVQVCASCVIFLSPDVLYVPRV